MRIVSLNAANFLGFDGTRASYLRKPLKPLLGDAADERANLSDFAGVLDDLEPDLVLLQEVDGGSLRTATDGQVAYLADALSDRYAYESAPKYHGPVLPWLPIWRQFSHGVLYTAGEVENHVIDTGVRSLVQEVTVGGLSVFSVHLANRGDRYRRKAIRKHQLREIAALASTRDRFAIVGDFNFADLEAEVAWLHSLLDCEVVVPGPTYPSHAPERPLDLAAVSPAVDVIACRPIDTAVSDHLPILVEVED